MKYQYKFITEKIKQEFDSKYTINDNCWVWNKYKDSDGYGQIHLKYDDGRHNMCRAHRISWMIHNKSDWPNTLPVARHTCNNPSCVNPEHIIPGTHQENMYDMMKAGRYVQNYGTRKPVMTPIGEFVSGQAAANALKISHDTLIKRLRSSDPTYYYIKE